MRKNAHQKLCGTGTRKSRKSAGDPVDENFSQAGQALHKRPATRPIGAHRRNPEVKAEEAKSTAEKATESREGIDEALAAQPEKVDGMFCEIRNLPPFSDEEEPADSREDEGWDTTKEVSDDEANIPSPMNVKGKTEKEYLEALEIKHYCEEHKKPCYVRSTGDHYQYIFGDLAKWARLLFDVKADPESDVPPEELNIHDHHYRQKLAKKAQAATVVQPQSDLSTPPAWAQQFLTATTAAPLMFGLPSFNPWAMMQGAAPQFGSPQKPASAAEQVAIRTAEAAAVVEDYPDIDEWLASLDRHPVRGRKSPNFSQYTAKLIENGITELGDLIHVSVEKLQELGGMNFGIANCMYRFAQEDNDALILQAKKARLD
ncbi:hypothetical protein BV22DRAFT_1134919 [Leucogyrophana mollusca]|uniref:Uncharacterized protein n=1 Tax=Leucogyrophana mollusca TaxID=85980 RepID=A0ACB8AWW7_9AGAM|nr:hypothetical protein BV22DRAFT_1134919 [Leucogyrophana mollusca]